MKTWGSSGGTNFAWLFIMKKPRKRMASTMASLPDPKPSGEPSTRRLDKMAAYSGKIRRSGRAVGTLKREDAAIVAQRR